MSATKLAVRAPDRVQSMCVASAPLQGIDFRSGRIRKEQSLVECLLRPLDEVEAAVVHRVLSREFRESHKERVKALEETVRGQSSSRIALAKHALAALMHRLGDDVQHLQMPTLVLAGTRDRLLDQVLLRELADAFASSEFRLLECGHDLTLERPERTAQLVGDFFRAHSP